MVVDRNCGFKFVFTVFTPTYNRAHTLPRVYESLKRQIFRDFEWLVIDDGSTDHTTELVYQWIRENVLPIRYIKQPHGHKKTAFNRAVREARRMFLLPLDSDDELLPNALEDLYKAWLDIPETCREHFAGVCGLCIDEGGRVVGDLFPKQVMYSDSLEMFYVYHVRGEKQGFVRVDVLQNFPFPEEISGHVPENVVWNRIAEHFKTVFINVPVRVYHFDAESVTRPFNRWEAIQRNCEGHAYWARETLDKELRYFWNDPFWFVKMAINYTRFHVHLARSQPGKRYPLHGRSARLLVSLVKPFGWGMFLVDCVRGAFKVTK